MNDPVEAERDFGCEVCWPSSADLAYEALGKLSISASLIDESHYIISLRQCPECSQSFVSVFTETIDWVDGEDPQYRTVMPLLPQEAADLAVAAEGEMERWLSLLAPQRRTLKMDFPKGKDMTLYWSHGISIGAHD